ncbi:MAG: M48 family metallopeptidase [Lachnospiraceae bacterium]|nr:M48 family metallopeptidase [Lachnospiraceae bacterium]
MNRDYELIRSRRRTVSVEITKDLSILVRAPKWMPLYEIDRFVEKNRKWIDNHLTKAANKKAQREKIDPISKEELARLKLEAKYVIPGRVGHYADILGVSYGRITVRSQKTLWGSCSAKGNLSFNCLLMAVPEHIRDYVIVHELCHRLHMDHSPAFWDCVSKIIPDYKACRRWLRNEGALYIEALDKGQE